MINALKLAQELVTAGITTHGNCNSNGVVWDDEGNEIQERADVAAIIAAHDPTPATVTVIEYDIPIKAPDFIIATPDVEKDPAKALKAAIAEARKGKGEKKSIGLISLSIIEYIDDLEKRVAKLEKK